MRAADFRGYGAVFIGVAFFATSLPLSQWAVEGLDGFTAGVGRATLGALLSAFALLVFRPALPKGRQWLHLAYAGVGTGFIFPGFTALGMQTVNPSEGAVVIAVLPLATAISARFIEPDRRLGPWFWAGSILAGLIVAAFILRDGFSGFVSGHFWLLLSLGVGFSYAWAGRVARDMPGWSVICWSLVLALPVQLMLFCLFWPTLDWTAGASAWAGLILGALGAQWAGFFFFYSGLAKVGSARGSLVQYAQPFLTIGIFAILSPLAMLDWRALPYAAAVVLALGLTRFDSEPK